MNTLNEAEKKVVALKALQEFKERIDEYPNIMGVGLGERHLKKGNGNKTFIIKIYVDWRFRFLRFLFGRSIPKFLSVVHPKDSKRIIKVPTEIETTGRVNIAGV